MIRDCDCGGNTICHYGKIYKTYMRIKCLLGFHEWERVKCTMLCEHSIASFSHPIKECKRCKVSSYNR